MANHDQFLYYYNRELEYLRNSGREFAKNHPKIARRLDLGDGESSDPHVERLLESFAFLTGKISQEIDQRFPETAAALLNNLYPHLLNPLPAMGIAHFKADPGRGKLTTGYEIPRHSPVFAEADEGINCRFRTVFPVKLWPISVQSADVVRANKYNYKQEPNVPDWFLRITLKGENLSFRDIELDDITFHLECDFRLATLIYEQIFSTQVSRNGVNLSGKVFFCNNKHDAYSLPFDSVVPVGFDVDETALPHGMNTLHSYQLLQEYFHLPEKFMFFKIKNLQEMIKKSDLDEDELEILIPIRDVSELYEVPLKTDYFLLGCAPVVNLFERTSDPFRLDKKKVQYLLIPDQQRDRTTEIYSITNVVGTIEGTPEPQPLSPYFAFDHHTTLNPDCVYWVSKRMSAGNRSLPGTDMYLSFVDLNFNPQLPPQQIIYAETLCTNRYLAEQLPYNTALQSEEAYPVHEVVLLDKPKAQVYSPSDGETLWQLISQLSINHLGVTSGQASVTAIGEMLKLYGAHNMTRVQSEVSLIKDIKSKEVVRRVNQEAWRGFVRGTELTLIMNDAKQSGTSAFLLASLLRQYFALHVGINSFVEVVLKEDELSREWMRWQPIPGNQIQL